MLSAREFREEAGVTKDGVAAPDSPGSPLPRLDDLRTALETMRGVNRHLNKENLAIGKKLKEKEGEVGALQEQLARLQSLLASERSRGKAAGALPPVARGGGAATVATTGEGVGRGPRWEHLREAGAAAGWLVRSPSEVELGDPLGHGTFGSTYRARWRGNPVAVKSVTVNDAASENEFLREVEVLARVRGPHIVPFVGACLEPPSSCWIITELMEGGTLHRWLHGPTGGPKPRRTLGERMQAAVGIARGMHALEAADPPVLHRDLKPSNVLMDGQGRPRVADFGLSRVGAEGVLTGETGTYQYMAPEVVRHEAYGGPADVYSFGVLLGELASCAFPYEGLYFSPVQIAMEVAKGKLAPPLPPSVHPGIAALVTACVDPNADARPTFAVLAPQLEHMAPEIVAAETAAADEFEGASPIQRLFGLGRRPQSALQGELPRGDDKPMSPRR